MPETETIPGTAPVIEAEPEVEEEQERTEEQDHEAIPEDSDIPPVFGRCPVCGKPLRPRCRYTGEPKAPPVGQGWLSRAKCDRCGAIIEYVGNGKWVPVEFLGEGGDP